MELFIQFDALGWRSERAAFATDHAADERAKVRTSEATILKWRRESTRDASMNAAASLNTELANFKAIVRYIVANDVDEANKELFRQHVSGRQWMLR